MVVRVLLAFSAGLTDDLNNHKYNINTCQHNIFKYDARFSAEAGCTTDWVYYADFGRFCGTGIPTLPAQTITPFIFHFNSDNSEAAMEVGTTGFQFDYTQAVC
jgi:hypothetical protein